MQQLYNNFSLKSLQTVLILGFYDRKNAGDEMYKIAIPRIFNDTKTKFIFKCMDDIDEIPDDISFVICGGGDIINNYFMQKAEKLFANYTGRVYAFSVGIPYVSESKYLHLFDHVFVRSINEYSLASKEIGTKNVTYLPDASFSLVKNNPQCDLPKTINLAVCLVQPDFHNNSQPDRPKTINLAVCLAQPAFYNNPNEEKMLDSLTTALSKIYKSKQNVKITLVSFNYSENNESESDYVINNKLYERLKNCGVESTYQKDIQDPMMIFDQIASMDVIIAMRYHSVLFGIISQKIVVPLYCSPKINKAIMDFKENLFASLKLDVDEQGKPSDIPHDKLFEILSNAMTTKQKYKLKDVDWSIAKKIMFEDKKLVTLIVKSTFDSFDSILYVCKRTLMKCLNWSSEDYDKTLYSQKPMKFSTKTHTNVARLICYCVTKSIQSPYLWGLQDNMKTQSFCLYDAIKFIWEDFTKETVFTLGQQYYPTLNIKRKAFVNLDFMFSNDFKSYHRSGWAYVVGGMMNIDSHQLLRNGKIMIDTYVDRSFHWGFDTLQTVDLIPYKNPWIGFIHHTFDITHSSYNCIELFNNSCFLESLKSCKGLIVLTAYLKNKLQDALISNGFAGVPVKVIYHPMEFVQKQFTIDNFLKNNNKRIIQIGAWLRNAYAIYELPLWKNKLNLQKAALKGKEMDHYFKPKDLLVKLKKELIDVENENANICGNEIQPVLEHQTNYTANNVNKYCDGLYKTIENNDKSVEVLERLTNDDYDVLLSENLVFLNLVDCSAVNTVLECLVRNTVIIVNRHPAIEEVLGKSYPGFYEDIVDAALLINDIKKISAAHTYLKKIDKKIYTLDHFINEFQDFVSTRE